MDDIYNLENDLAFMQMELIQGAVFESLEITNNYKEEVLRALEERVIELEKDGEKNFLAIETIKLFIEQNFWRI